MFYGRKSPASTVDMQGFSCMLIEVSLFYLLETEVDSLREQNSLLETGKFKLEKTVNEQNLRLAALEQQGRDTEQVGQCDYF